MKLNYEILGCEDLKHRFQSQIKIDEDFLGLGNYPTEYSQTYSRHLDSQLCLELAVFRHLGLDVSLEHLERYVSEGTKIAVDYFFGEYLDSDEVRKLEDMEKSPDNEYLRWFAVYRNGLHLAHMAEDADAEKTLVDWIEPWLPFDESSYLVSEQDNSYHKLLAEYIKTGRVSNAELIDGIQKSRRKGPKLLLDCLVAIRDKNAKAFSAKLNNYLTYVLKDKEFGTEFTLCFSIEGSILCHVAKRAGIEPTGLNEKQTALIMTRETLGLASQ